MWVIMGSFKDGSWMPELRRGFADSLEAWGGGRALIKMVMIPRD